MPLKEIDCGAMPELAEVVNDAVGATLAGDTVMVRVAELVAPSSSVTVSVAVKVPAVV